MPTAGVLLIFWHYRAFPFVDARNPTASPGTPFKNPTSTYDDLYQFHKILFLIGSTIRVIQTESMTVLTTMLEGAWQFILTAEEAGQSVSVAICVHTPNAMCNNPCFEAEATMNCRVNNVPGQLCQADNSGQTALVRPVTTSSWVVMGMIVYVA